MNLEGEGQALTATARRADQLLGRRAEREAIATTLREARDAHAALLLVGDAGIGKSQLCSYAIHEASSAGFRTLAAAGGEVERGLPYSALADLFRREADTLTAALPPPLARAMDAVLLRADAPERLEPRAVALAVLESLDRLGGEGPLAIILDDLHWVDPASAKVLAFALRRVAAPATALIGGQRPGPRPPLDLRAAWPDGRLRALTIQPLDPDSLAELLVRRLGRRLPLPTLHRILTLSSGNPLVALELARLDEAELGDLAAFEADRFPQQIARLVGGRLARLSRRQSHAIAQIALMTHPTDRALAGLGIAPGDLRDGVEAGVLRRSGPVWEFTHPLVRSAAASRLTRAERRAVHARLAEQTVDALERATHVARSRDVPDERAAALVEAGARAAMQRGAPLAGAQLAERAVALTMPADESARFDRLLLAGALRHQAGDNRTATRLLSSALATAPRGRRGEALLELARVEAETAGSAVATGRLRMALRASTEDRLRGAIHMELAEWLRFTEPLRVARRHARMAVSAAGRTGDQRLLARCRSVDLFLSFNATGRFDEAQIRDVDDIVLGHILVWDGQFERARALLGTPVIGPWSFRSSSRSWYLALADLWTGDWEEALRLLAELERLTESRSESMTAVQALRSLVVAHLGHPEAPNEARSSRRLAEREGWKRFAAMADTALGIWYLAHADPARAARALEPSVQRALRLGLMVPGASLFLPDAIEGLAGAGRIHEARALADQVKRRTRGWRARMFRAGFQRALAMLAAAEGHETRALRILDAEADRDSLGDLPFLRARKDLVRGRILRHSRRRSAARAALQAARETFEALSAEPWVALTNRELGRIGDRPGGRHGLTFTESRVADLAGDGRTNREIAGILVMSVKTVEWNLTRVYQKLGVRSRAELAATRRTTQAKPGPSPTHDT